MGSRASDPPAGPDGNHPAPARRPKVDRSPRIRIHRSAIWLRRSAAVFLRGTSRSNNERTSRKNNPPKLNRSSDSASKTPVENRDGVLSRARFRPGRRSWICRTPRNYQKPTHSLGFLLAKGDDFPELAAHPNPLIRPGLHHSSRAGSPQGNESFPPVLAGSGKALPGFSDSGSLVEGEFQLNASLNGENTS